MKHVIQARTTPTSSLNPRDALESIPTGSRPGFASALRSRGLAAILLLGGAALTAGLGQAQPAIPRIGYVYPAGGQQGTSFQATLGGQFLSGATNVLISGEGAEAAVVEYTRPLTPQQFRTLREEMQKLQDKRAAATRDARRRGTAGSGSTTNLTWTAKDEEALAELRKKLANPPSRMANPAIAEKVVLEVRLAPEAEPGERELRIETPSGLSNPLLFLVGQLPEFSERPGPTNALARPAASGRPGREGAGAAPATEMTVTLPCVVNGQILPGGVDRFRFKARQGTRLVAAAAARRLIPYLPDAVPGWFQASLALYDPKGGELAHADHFRFDPDPVLALELPRDGEYVLEIRDSIFRGREDFVYRVTLGELPFATSHFPLGGAADAVTAVEMTGWNLPSGRVTYEGSGGPPGLAFVRAGTGNRPANPLPFAVDTLPEGLDREPNNSADAPQRLVRPVIVNGRIDAPGDWDVFRFEGRAGEEIVAEVMARRLDSPLDSMLRLTDGAGKLLAVNDDHEDRGAGLDTHYADSYLRFTLPSDGPYCVHLGDAQQQGGPEQAYRLRLSPPRPDFALRVVPSTLNVRGGASVPFTVYALRKDGFTNAITLALADAPPGFALSGARVPAGQDQVRLTLTAPSAAPPAPTRLTLQGRATIHGQVVSRPAVPAEDMMQAFSYHHLVPAKELRAAVNGRGATRGAPKILGESPVRIPLGGTARVRLGGPAAALANRFQLELSEPPEGLAVQGVNPTREGAELVLACDAARAKPGLQGNLIVSIFNARNPTNIARPRAAGNQRRSAVGTLPAIPFEITGP